MSLPNSKYQTRPYRPRWSIFVDHKRMRFLETWTPMTIYEDAPYGGYRRDYQREGEPWWQPARKFLQQTDTPGPWRKARSSARSPAQEKTP